MTASYPLALTLALLAGAILLDWLIGDPRWLWRVLPHPVVIIGKLVGFLEKRLNRIRFSDGARRFYGVLTVLIVVSASAGAGYALHRYTASHRWGWVAELALVTVLLAQRDLFDHVRRVRTGLIKGGLQGGRDAVSHIVGRDPTSLDVYGVSRAAIESLAENFADGVVAPACWYLAFGPAGILAYKAINTLDSMIGHRSVRYRNFGWAAARLDDLANLIPARLAGLFIALGALFLPRASAGAALVTIARDAGKHRSPNAGWPEAAMAGALDLALAGPRRYGSETVNDPWIGKGRAKCNAQDMRRALMLFALACLMQFAAVAGLMLLLLR